MVVHQEFFALFIGCPEGVAGGTADLTEFFMADHFPGDQSHIPGTGVVVIVRETMGVDKMSVRASQFCGPLIHKISERFQSLRRVRRWHWNIRWQIPS